MLDDLDPTFAILVNVEQTANHHMAQYGIPEDQRSQIIWQTYWDMRPTMDHAYGVRSMLRSRHGIWKAR